MPLMMLLTSCGEGGSFLRVNNSLGLALRELRLHLVRKKPVALLAGLLLRHVSPFWRVYAILADNTTIDNNRPYGKLYFSGGSAD